MGAGSGDGARDCIVITNHTKKQININATDGGVRKTFAIDPKDSYIIFTDKAETVSWERSN